VNKANVFTIMTDDLKNTKSRTTFCIIIFDSNKNIREEVVDVIYIFQRTSDKPKTEVIIMTL